MCWLQMLELCSVLFWYCFDDLMVNLEEWMQLYIWAFQTFRFTKLWFRVSIQTRNPLSISLEITQNSWRTMLLQFPFFPQFTSKSIPVNHVHVVQHKIHSFFPRITYTRKKWLYEESNFPFLLCFPFVLQFFST